MNRIVLFFCFFLISACVAGQGTARKFYKDFDMIKLKGIDEIPGSQLAENKRYLQINTVAGRTVSISVFDTVNGKTQKTDNLKFAARDGIVAVEFPVSKRTVYEGNVFWHRQVKTKTKWFLGRDSIFILATSPAKAYDGGFAIVSFPQNDILEYRSYSIGHSDVDLSKTSGPETVAYLTYKIEADTSLYYSVDKIDLKGWRWLTCRTNIDASWKPCPDEATINKELLSSGKSVFWFLYTYRT